MNAVEGAATILVGEDELDVLCYFDLALRSFGYNVEKAQDGDELLSCLRASRSEVVAVLLDVFMPNRDGLETLREIRKFYPNMPVIVVSGVTTPQNIVTAIKSGANDFLCKPVPHETLGRALQNALKTRTSLGSAPLRPHSGGANALVGRSPRMKEIQEIAGQVGWSEASVLIQGETGTGKEVLARQLHAESPRAEKLFLKVNCAALPSELVESELFGYERGAFTGAVQRKIGMFEMADGGTIFLDEIGDMDLHLQAKLLQVLQDHEFRRIGGKEIVKVDVRVIAATHRDLEKSILEQKFREDLYYRLSVVTLLVPALRDRRDDIVPLAEFLLAKSFGKAGHSPALEPELKRALTEYHWPGNVRELENYMRKLMIMGDGNLIAHELRIRSRKNVSPLEVPDQPSAYPPASQEKIPILEPVTKANNQSDKSAIAHLEVAILEPLIKTDRQAEKNVIVSAAAPRQEVPILEQVIKANHQAERNAILSALGSTRWNRKHASVLLNVDYKVLLYKMRKLGIERPGSVAVKAESDSPVIARAQANGN